MEYSHDYEWDEKSRKYKTRKDENNENLLNSRNSSPAAMEGFYVGMGFLDEDSYGDSALKNSTTNKFTSQRLTDSGHVQDLFVENKSFKTPEGYVVGDSVRQIIIEKISKSNSNEHSGNGSTPKVPEKKPTIPPLSFANGGKLFGTKNESRKESGFTNNDNFSRYQRYRSSLFNFRNFRDFRSSREVTEFDNRTSILFGKDTDSKSYVTKRRMQSNRERKTRLLVAFTSVFVVFLSYSLYVILALPQCGCDYSYPSRNSSTSKKFAIFRTRMLRDKDDELYADYDYVASFDPDHFEVDIKVEEHLSKNEYWRKFLNEIFNADKESYHESISLAKEEHSAKNVDYPAKLNEYKLKAKLIDLYTALDKLHVFKTHRQWKRAKNSEVLGDWTFYADYSAFDEATGKLFGKSLDGIQGDMDYFESSFDEMKWILSFNHEENNSGLYDSEHDDWVERIEFNAETSSLKSETLYDDLHHLPKLSSAYTNALSSRILSDVEGNMGSNENSLETREFVFKQGRRSLRYLLRQNGCEIGFEDSVENDENVFKQGLFSKSTAGEKAVSASSRNSNLRKTAINSSSTTTCKLIRDDSRLRFTASNKMPNKSGLGINSFIVKFAI